MSGGVDSSVTAALLKEQGYQVTGVYMKNWSQDLPGMVCPWKQDYQDAKRVAVHLGIPFKMYDFETEYRQKVVDYMVCEYQAGRTPNPDIMCNQEVKFKLFLETCLNDGADMIATGHYARTEGGKLLTAKNAEKDQTYFLYRVTEDALKHSLMPIGDIETKDEVRALAQKFGLATVEEAELMQTNDEAFRRDMQHNFLAVDFFAVAMRCVLRGRCRRRSGGVGKAITVPETGPRGQPAGSAWPIK